MEANEFLHFPDYYILYKLRKGRTGGGVAILVNDGLEYNEIDFFADYDAEIVGVSLKTGEKKTAIACYYNPPDVKIDNKINRYLANNFDEFLIVGDLNAHIIPYSTNIDANGRILQDILLGSN